ncbi:DUF1801 domain-containing protein [Balneola sp. MJW-20]|uniref:DUF1801 domain-containing protein n=1 Tax=Gracilimonas aurantiaca TaxID=3234185 RepID=UPI00346561A2
MNKVEDFIYCHEGDQREIMLYFHHFLMNFPTVTCSIKHGIPFYDQNKWVCYLNPVKSGAVALSFIYGNKLSNEQGLLESKGRKQVMSAEFKRLEEIPRDAVRQIINEALMLDEMRSG